MVDTIKSSSVIASDPGAASDFRIVPVPEPMEPAAYVCEALPQVAEITITSLALVVVKDAEVIDDTGPPAAPVMAASLGEVAFRPEYCAVIMPLNACSCPNDHTQDTTSAALPDTFLAYQKLYVLPEMAVTEANNVKVFNAVSVTEFGRSVEVLPPRHVAVSKLPAVTEAPEVEIVSSFVDV